MSETEARVREEVGEEVVTDMGQTKYDERLFQGDNNKWTKARPYILNRGGP